MPGASNQKRKRGGRPSAPAAAESASGRASKRVTAGKAQLDERNGDTNSGRRDHLASTAGKRDTKMAESPNPKKRGRSTKGEKEGTDSGEKTRPSKRMKQVEEDASKEPTARRSNRDRRSTDDNPWWAAKSGATSPVTQPENAPRKQSSKQTQGTSKGASDTVVKKSTAKPAPAEAQPDLEQEQDQEPEPEQEARPAKASKQAKASPAGGDVRRSSRDRRSADDSPWWSAQTTAQSPQNAPPQKAFSGPATKPGRGRSSLGEVPVSQAQNQVSEGSGKQTSKGSRQKSTADASSQRAVPAQIVKQFPSRSRARSSNAGSEAGTSKRRRSSGTSSEPQRRRQSDQSEAAAESSSASAPKYRHLASRTRQIPRATISAKWSSLDDASIAAIDSIISEASRPVLSRFRDRDQRHQQAQTIFRTFAKRLHSKLVKGLPFPPPSTATGRGTAASSSSHELEFDFERTVDGIQALEKTLEPLLHSVALLSTERDREEEALEKEYKVLKALETNARAEARQWREHEKRDHVLAPGLRAPEQDASKELERIRSAKVAAVGGVFKVRGTLGQARVDTELTGMTGLEGGKSSDTLAANWKPYGEHEGKPAAGRWRAPGHCQKPSGAPGSVARISRSGTV